MFKQITLTVSLSPPLSLSICPYRPSHLVQPYSCTEMATARKNSLFVSLERKDFKIFNYLSLLKSKFTFIGNSVLSTENDINMRLARAWIAIDKLSIIWKSNFSDKIKHFFPGSGCVSSTIWMHHMDAI